MATKDKNKQEFYARLIPYPGRKFGLNVLVGIGWIVFSYLIFNNAISGYDWRLIALPVGLIGLTFCLFPDTEEWEYKPWQASAQQYERHFKD